MAVEAVFMAMLVYADDTTTCAGEVQQRVTGNKRVCAPYSDRRQQRQP